jgi:serine/threonine protein kinase
MPDISRWEIMKRLGEGGQGEVFLVRTPARVAARKKARARIPYCIGNIRGYEGASSDSVVGELLDAIVEYTRPDSPAELGALKQFKIATDDKEREAEAVGRLQAEIKVLQQTANPAVLRLLDSNVDERFIVTEFHPGGTLDQHLARYKGKPMEALLALRPLVQAVVAIHHTHGAIHRDIKTENIFVATDGRLVLGDFGVVFLQGPERLTSTSERVGSHYWMAPWACKNERLRMDQVTQSLDLFPLAKVLWSMISGRNGFGYWEWNRHENNLEAMFPDSPMVALVNREIISKCVVREEEDCIKHSAFLLQVFDALIELGQRVGQRMEGETTWHCRVCGKGAYHSASPPEGVGSQAPVILARIPGWSVSSRHSFSIFVCDHCGHAELFKASGGHTG